MLIGFLIILRRGIAQLVEHRSPKPGVGGSSPSAPAKFKVYDLEPRASQGANGGSSPSAPAKFKVH